MHVIYISRFLGDIYIHIYKHLYLMMIMMMIIQWWLPYISIYAYMLYILSYYIYILYYIYSNWFLTKNWNKFNGLGLFIFITHLH